MSRNGVDGAGRAADGIVELCAFRVGDEEYVIDIRRIREIVQPLAIVPVPRAPEWMEGVANLRGEVLPVVDARRRLGLPPRAASRGAKFLIVNVAGRLLALVVDAVSEVVRIPRSAIGPPPMEAGSAGRLFVGVCGARPADAAARTGRSPDRDGTPARGSGPAHRLRLLLNVKALLDPPAPAEGGAR